MVTIVDLLCWVPCQEFVLIIYDRIAYVMSILSVHITDVYTRVIFYVRRMVDLIKTAKVNAYIMHIFGKIELLSIHST